jgi:hypothetical protein
MAGLKLINAKILPAGCAGKGDWASSDVQDFDRQRSFFGTETLMGLASGSEMRKTVSWGRSKIEILAECGWRILCQRPGRIINAKFACA